MVMICMHCVREIGLNLFWSLSIPVHDSFLVPLLFLTNLQQQSLLPPIAAARTFTVALFASSPLTTHVTIEVMLQSRTFYVKLLLPDAP